MQIIYLYFFKDSILETEKEEMDEEINKQLDVKDLIEIKEVFEFNRIEIPIRI